MATTTTAATTENAEAGGDSGGGGKTIKRRRHAQAATASASAPYEHRKTLPMRGVQEDQWLQEGDLLDGRFIVRGALGSGTFGQVYRAEDGARGDSVAIKCIKADDRYTAQARAEAEILEYLEQQAVSGVVRLRHRFVHRGHTCLVMDLMHINLLELLRRRARAQSAPSAAIAGATMPRPDGRVGGTPLWMVRLIARQLLSSLAQMVRPGQRKLIHCDVKPENVALRYRQGYVVSLLDFGSACFVDQPVRQRYAQSRSYRAPEIVLRLGYNQEVDVWSLGATLVQLYTGRTLFATDGEENLLRRQVQVLGMPPDWMCRNSPKFELYFRSVAPTGSSSSTCALLKPPTPASSPLWDILAAAPRKAQPLSAEAEEAHLQQLRAFHQLVCGMLTFDPTQRTTPAQALQHEFLKDEF